MLIKKKSLIVAIISSLVICLVLVMNLAGYLIYLEMKDDEREKAYRVNLREVNAKVYSKHIEIARLDAGFDRTGTLKGEAVLEGIVRNDGYRDIKDLLIRVKFLDGDGAVLYEVTFRPQEPSLGSYEVFTQASIPHLSGHSMSAIKPESSFPFKKILSNCPKEILSELKESSGSLQAGRQAASGKGRWGGRFDYEILSVDF